MAVAPDARREGATAFQAVRRGAARSSRPRWPWHPTRGARVPRPSRPCGEALHVRHGQDGRGTRRAARGCHGLPGRAARRCTFVTAKMAVAPDARREGATAFQAVRRGAARSSRPRWPWHPTRGTRVPRPSRPCGEALHVRHGQDGRGTRRARDGCHGLPGRAQRPETMTPLYVACRRRTPFVPDHRNPFRRLHHSSTAPYPRNRSCSFSLGIAQASAGPNHRTRFRATRRYAQSRTGAGRPARAPPPCATGHR